MLRGYFAGWCESLPDIAADWRRCVRKVWSLFGSRRAHLGRANDAWRGITCRRFVRGSALIEDVYCSKNAILIHSVETVRGSREADMRKKLIAVITFVVFGMPSLSLACYDHMMFNPNNMGLVEGTIARMAGLVPPKPVFDVVHPSMARVQVGEKSALTVSFSRPIWSKNVALKVRGTRNVVLDVDEFALEDRSGSVSFGYELTDGASYESIIVTVTGEYDGKIVNQSSQIYLRGV